MPTTANTINYYVAADGTLRDSQQGSIAQTPRINYGTEYAVTLSFPPSTIAEGDQLQVALNRSRTFFSSASATGDAPVAAVVKHDVTAEEATAQEVSVVLSTNTRAMIDQVNGIDHPVRGFFGVHILRGQSFVTLAVADALMMSLESGPDAISPSLPVVDYPTREEAIAIKDEAMVAAGKAKEEADRAEEAAAGIVPPLQLSSPPTTSTVGSVGQLAVWHDSATNKDHLYHLCFASEGESATLYHWEECVLVSQGNVAGGYPVLDVNGKVERNVLPIIGTEVFGVAKLATNPSQGAVGLQVTSNGTLYTVKASNAQIDNKNAYPSAGYENYNIIAPNNLDYAVRSVLPNVTEIPAATSDYSLVDSSATTNNHSHVYSHSPSAVPTYRLPQVTNTAIAHYIELTVDFTNVQTYSFLDYQGEPIVPLFTPAIAAGDVYTFKMEYSAIKGAWLIYPQKQGAVADDFVMRGEVGAANGVAGLDANGKLQPSQLPAIIDTTAPTTSTVGVVGQLYVNTATSKTYHCTAITNTGTESEPVWSYAWTDDINAKGGIFTSAIQVNSANNTANTRIKPQGHIDGGFNSDSGSSGYGSIAIGYNAKAMASHGAASFGAGTTAGYNSQLVTGKYNLAKDRARLTGNGTNNSIRKNIEELSWNGDLYIAGGHQQGITVIPAATTAYTLAEGIFTHAPTSAPAYTLPSITDDIRTHEVVLVIDFSSVQTFSFLVDGGGDVTFQSYANPTKGDVWAFRCWWYGGKWRIMPMKIKNCVTRQLVNGSLSITDAVGGNALALKMTAPRSVVVNQHINATDTSVTLTSGRTWMTYIGGVGAKVTGEGQSVTCTGGTDMAVDLTQYFNGDSALIDSITSWDDLVAYDPRFARYVEYNTGTVTGVQPTVKVTGKNLVDIGTQTFTSTYLKSGLNIPPGTYKLSAEITSESTSSGILCYIYTSNNSPIWHNTLSKTGRSAITVTVTRPIESIRLYAGSSASDSTGKTATWKDVQLELGSVTTSYEPYHDGGTAQAPAPLFAVGNAADEFEAVSGVTTRKIGSRDMANVASATDYFAPSTQYPYGYTILNVDGRATGQNLLCSKYSLGSNLTQNKTIRGAGSGVNVYVVDDSLAGKTGAQIKEALSGIYLYYELATPTTSTSTPTQISLQAGSNTAMQTDGGRLAPIDITYESDEL